MKNTALRYGLYGALTICILFLLTLFLGKSLSDKTQEILGFVNIGISLLFVFFGIKHFRDKENNGLLSIKDGLIIGVIIALITALAFGILDFIYVRYLNPEFIDTYYANLVEQANQNLSGTALADKLNAITSEKELFSNPFMSFFFMFIMVFVIGLIITIISSLALQRKLKSL